jgi:hypothetical protein
MGMENLIINNMFTGCSGSVNMNQSDGQAASAEGDSKNFMSVLKDIMNTGCLKEDAMAMGNSVVSQQPCIQQIYPLLLLGLLQNISNANAQKGKDAGIFSNDTSQQQLNGGDGSSDADDENTVEIDITGMDISQVQAILLLLNSISEALNEKGGDLDIAEFIGKNFSDDAFVENINESIEEGQEGQSLFDGLPKTKPMGETVKPIQQQLQENIAAVPVMNNVYLNNEQSLKKDMKGDDSDISSSKDRIPVDYLLNISTGSNQKKLPDDMNSDVRNNLEGLTKNIINTNQGKNSSKESFFGKYQQINLDAGYSENKENSIQTLLSQAEKRFDESVITVKKEVADMQSEDLKLLSKDDNYPSFSKQDNFENTLVREAQSNKVVKETIFTSVMAEKIEKIVEQYSTKGSSMDMIVRLKINDNDTLLVGLKNDGQRVMVDVRSTSGNIMNIMQTQKDDIIRNLEEKNIFTNIYVDPDGNGSFERREARQDNQRNSKEKARQDDFIEFLETSVQGGA